MRLYSRSFNFHNWSQFYRDVQLCLQLCIRERVARVINRISDTRAARRSRVCRDKTTATLGMYTDTLRTFVLGGGDPGEPQASRVSSACVRALRNAARTSQSCDTMALTSDDRPTGALWASAWFAATRLTTSSRHPQPRDEAFPYDSEGTYTLAGDRNDEENATRRRSLNVQCYRVPKAVSGIENSARRRQLW